MCGKFTAMASWAEVVAFSQAMTRRDGGGEEDEGSGGGDNDREITYRVGHELPVIIWDAEAGKRRIVMMRWGFPAPSDWRRPQPIHARSETVHAKWPFREPLTAGRRGIVIFRTFNEADEVPTRTGGKKTRQWRIDPRDGKPRAFAFVWDEFRIADLPAPLRACVMVTVPANELIRTRILPDDPDARMPAILAEEDIAMWLGETPAPMTEVLATLRTVEGVHWDAAPEAKPPKKLRA